ncbi:MAG: hypothetical protein NC336_05000 [Clostridium sp.]|nr:hypothetical protein [Clostridium sp.]
MLNPGKHTQTNQNPARRRPKTRVVDFIAERDAELQQIFYSKLSDPACAKMSMDEIWEAVVAEGASRVWLSPEQASRILHQTLRGTFRPVNPSRRRLALWLTSRYIEETVSGAVTTVSQFIRWIFPELTPPEQFISAATARKRVSGLVGRHTN